MRLINSLFSWLIIGFIFASPIFIPKPIMNIIILCFRNLNGFVQAGLLAAFTGFVAGSFAAYMVKRNRHKLRPWNKDGKDHTPDPMIRNPPSGTDSYIQLYGEHKVPSFLGRPFAHIFLPWFIDVSEVDMGTGSVSHTDKKMSWIASDDANCRNIGDNDMITGVAAAKMLARMEGIKRQGMLSEDDRKFRDVMKALKGAGVRFRPDVLPQPLTVQLSADQEYTKLSGEVAKQLKNAATSLNSAGSRVSALNKTIKGSSKKK